MLIENKWFVFQAPRRVDLSGRPLGFLFIWRPLPFGWEWTPYEHVDGKGEKRPGFWRRVGDRFAPTPNMGSFGICVPPAWLARFVERLHSKGHETLTSAQFIEQPENTIPNEWERWPDLHKRACAAAVARAVSERPGSQVVKDVSFCDRRIDLSGRPLQLYRSITLRRA